MNGAGSGGARGEVPLGDLRLHVRPNLGRAVSGRPGAACDNDGQGLPDIGQCVGRKQGEAGGLQQREQGVDGGQGVLPQVGAAQYRNHVGCRTG